MQPTDDSMLLRQYAENQSDGAFAALVTRHINLVYSVALRHVGNPHNAEEITQAVFVILAKKAPSLRHDKALSSWLFQVTRLTASNFIRSETRRHHREEEAYMQSVLEEDGTEVWPRIAPLLDTAVANLREKDRQAIVLRFYDGRNLREVGLALGANEDAAEKRVNRALEKLRKFFTRHGVYSTTAIIAGTISVNSIQAAPVALAKSMTTVAIAKGSIAAASTLTLVKGTMKIMTWMKIKFAIGVGMAALLVGGVVTVAISQNSSDDKLTAQDIAGKSRDAYAALASYSDSGTVVYQIGSQQITTAFNIRLQRPNLYRIDWTQTGGISTTKGMVWSDGSGNYSLMGDPMGVNVPGQKPKLKQMPDMKTALTLATGLSGSAASTIPGAFFNQDLGDVFIAPVASGRYPLQKEPDAKVSDVDCFVVSSVLDFSKIPDNKGKPGTASTTLWIGKRDFLIHQCRTKYVEKMDSSASSDQAIDEAIKKALQAQSKPATPEAIAAMRPQMRAIMKQVQGTLKSSFESGVVFTQTHENIVVNRKFSPADFEEAQ
ncbi:MAG TPA: sigma-70 family RNA polymerase sigma factor [Candidatus Limnocylindrales bacterium]|nr:sigma-70 family RNA polymerase sigma factor [Candidatus Limnocylindrales bacterium]